MKIRILTAIAVCAAISLFGLIPHAGAQAKVSERSKNILKQIHERHAALGAAVKGKNLEAAHEQADSIQELSDELVSEVGQEHKSGVEKLILSINEVHDSAESGNQSASEANLKKLDGALKELDTQFVKKEEVKVSDRAKSLLKQIHEHHKELAAAVKNKNLEAAHEHADSIQGLTDELSSEVAAPHKAGVEKLVQAINEVHDSAEGGNQSGTETNLKKLDGALKDLDALFQGGQKARISNKAKEILKQIDEHHAKLGGLVKARNLEAAHDEVDTIQDLAESFTEEVGEAHHSKLEKLEKVLEQLHDAVDEGQQVATEANLKKFEEALKEVDSHFAR